MEWEREWWERIVTECQEAQNMRRHRSHVPKPVED